MGYLLKFTSSENIQGYIINPKTEGNGYDGPTEKSQQIGQSKPVDSLYPVMPDAGKHCVDRERDGWYIKCVLTQPDERNIKGNLDRIHQIGEEYHYSRIQAKMYSQECTYNGDDAQQWNDAQGDTQGYRQRQLFRSNSLLQQIEKGLDDFPPEITVFPGLHSND